MNSVLRWLHKNEGLVHMCVMLVVFYGIPTAALSVLYPHLIEPLLNSAVMGLTLVTLLYVSYKAASMVTEWVKNTVTQATLDQIRDLTLENAKKVSDPIVDFSSTNVLVVNNVSDETKEAVSNLKSGTETVVSVPSVSVEKKKRTTRSKSVKKES